jgi:hypothetical protein
VRGPRLTRPDAFTWSSPHRNRRRGGRRPRDTRRAARHAHCRSACGQPRLPELVPCESLVGSARNTRIGPDSGSDVPKGDPWVLAAIATWAAGDSLTEASEALDGVRVGQRVREAGGRAGAAIDARADVAEVWVRASCSAGCFEVENFGPGRVERDPCPLVAPAVQLDLAGGWAGRRLPPMAREVHGVSCRRRGRRAVCARRPRVGRRIRTHRRGSRRGGSGTRSPPDRATRRWPLPCVR